MGALSGRCALVVGGAGGIGGGIAEAFLAAGATVVIADYNEEFTNRRAREIGSLGVTIDVTNETSVRYAVATATKLMGRIDILVNSAGIATQSPVVDMSLEIWNETLAVDLSGVFLVTHHVLPQMLSRGDGRIINVASQLGIKGAASLAHYAAAKAGVIAFTKSLALEVYTQMVAGIDEEWKAAKAKELPLGRFGEVEEVAPTAVLLASSPGGNLYVGQTLGPNSGDVMP